MFKVGDFVKVKSLALVAKGVRKELVPIGTICRVESVESEKDGSFYYLVRSLNNDYDKGYYTEDELKKGRLEWVEKFYFTFGSSSFFPHQNGYVIVWAKNLNEAFEIFKAKYPNKTPNCLNCSFYYTEEQWKKQYEKTGLIKDYPCFEVLGETSL